MNDMSIYMIIYLNSLKIIFLATILFPFILYDSSKSSWFLVAYLEKNMPFKSVLSKCFEQKLITLPFSQKKRYRNEWVKILTDAHNITDRP